MAEESIFKISVPTDEIDKAIQEISTMRKRVEELREANKQMGDKSSEAYAKNAIEIKRLNGEIRTNERVVVANTKAQKANEGSIKQLRSQLSQVSSRWAELSKEERENTEAGRRLTKQKTDLTNKLKTLESQTGDNRRNVGNYSQGMLEAIKSSGGLSKATAGLNSVMSANPIMLVVTALIAFGQKVSAAQSIVDFFSRTLEPLNQAFQRTIGLVQELIEGGFSKLGEIIRDPIGALRNLGTELKQAADDGRRIAELTIEIEEAENDLILTRGRLRRSIEENRFAIEDLSKTEEERVQSAKDALNDLNELRDAELSVLNKQIEQAELRAAQNDTDRAAQRELNELLAKRDELQAQTVSQQKEIRNQLNSINKAAADELRRQEAEATKAYEQQQKERTKIAEQEEEARVEAFKKAQERRAQIAADNFELENEKYLNALKQQLLDAEITREEYDQRLLERQQEILEIQIGFLRSFGADTTELESQLLDVRLKNLEKQTKAQEASAKANESIKKSEFDTAKSVSDGVTSLVKQAAGENTAVAKAVGLTNTFINIAEGITKAVAQGGPIIGPILSAIVTTIGAVQQAAIRRQPTNFADGVIGLNGPGSETSDSIPANLSRGESVMTAKATKAFAPQLAQMEMMVGNKPNFQLNNLKFAKGIIGIDNATGITNARSLTKNTEQLVKMVDDRPVFVSLTELEREQKKTNNQRSYAKFIE